VGPIARSASAIGAPCAGSGPRQTDLSQPALHIQLVSHGLISLADEHSKDRFASFNGSAPVEASSGNSTGVCRLSRRGNRQLNHALHMIAVTQIRFSDTEGRAYYDKKRAEGMGGKAALRALKRRISDRLYAAMVADAKRVEAGPGG